jgi:hypothetical protein
MILTKFSVVFSPIDLVKMWYPMFSGEMGTPGVPGIPSLPGLNGSDGIAGIPGKGHCSFSPRLELLIFSEILAWMGKYLKKSVHFLTIKICCQIVQNCTKAKIGTLGE